MTSFKNLSVAKEYAVLVFYLHALQSFMGFSAAPFVIKKINK